MFGYVVPSSMFVYFLFTAWEMWEIPPRSSWCLNLSFVLPGNSPRLNQFAGRTTLELFHLHHDENDCEMMMVVQLMVLSVVMITIKTEKLKSAAENSSFARTPILPQLLDPSWIAPDSWIPNPPHSPYRTLLTAPPRPILTDFPQICSDNLSSSSSPSSWSASSC